MLVDPLTTDQWVLQPGTAVTLATLSMESPSLPELVGVEAGVGQLQLVNVSGMDLFVQYIISHTGNCPELPSLTNGMIMYSSGSPDITPFLSSAVYSCNLGYTLTGGTFTEGTTRICMSGGRWGGSPPTCQGEFLIVQFVFASITVRA